MEKPKVFISYSHSTDDHKNKIREFATMLRSHGVDATIDEWELVGGNDLNAFMEKQIKEADKVIIACDKVYSEKANKKCFCFSENTTYFFALSKKTNVQFFSTI